MLAGRDRLDSLLVLKSQYGAQRVCSIIIGMVGGFLGGSCLRRLSATAGQSE